VVADARFCGQCGAALDRQPGGPAATEDAPATPSEGDRGEHKPVTVVFCDIVDSTGIAERLGSEATHRMLDRFLRVAVEEVERYGGTVDKFLGDGFLALVGVPLAHEDHARRALLLALAIRRRLADDWPEDEAGPAPRIRMGINTGTVLMGTVGGERQADYTAVGDTANVAARLQALAQPGEILASEATVRLVAGYARLEPVGARADPRSRGWCRAP
jgi:class 3 adenylate cyclase